MGLGQTRGRKAPSSGASIKPKEKKNNWQEAATAVSVAAKSASGESDAGGGEAMDSDAQAYKQMGDAGQSIAETYKANKSKSAGTKGMGSGGGGVGGMS